MSHILRFALFGVLLITAGLAQAREVAGVSLPETVSTEDGVSLQLNGAGTRTKFFVTVYVGALYTASPVREAEAAITAAGPKRVTLSFVHDRVSREKITAAWREGIEANVSAAEFAALGERLSRFNSGFEDMRTGDTIQLDFPTTGGVHVTVKGQDKGTVEGEDFSQALLRVWLGEHPADRGLKAAMLGK